MIIVAALVVTGASIILPFMSSYMLVAGSQMAAGAAEAFFAPTVAAITLGIMGPRAFTRRIGRNETFNHAGNAFATALAGVCAWTFGLILAERAKQAGIKLSFLAYGRIGLPLTLASLGFGTWWLA